MPTRKEGLLVLYPEYFDRNLSRAEGRRVPRNQAVEEPTVQALFRAATAAGLDPQLQTDHHHSANWRSRKGRVLVRKSDAGRKEQLLGRLAALLPAHLGEASTTRSTTAPRSIPAAVAPTGRPERKHKGKRKGGFAKRRKG